MCLELLAANGRQALRTRQLASAAGFASHVADIWPQARRRLRPLWVDMNSTGVYALWQSQPGADPVVHLSALSVQNLDWLYRALASPPVRSLHCAGGPLSAWGHKSPEFLNWRSLASEGLIHVVETDASKLVGWSYHVCADSQVVSGVWPDHFVLEEGHSNATDINYKELWVAWQCLLREGQAFAGWRVQFRMDNTAAVHYVNTRHGRIPSLQELASRFEAAEQLARCWALAVHIRGVHNPVADGGSCSPSFALAWSACPFRDAVLRRDLFREVESRSQVSFTLDLFADRAGLAALAPKWCFPELTAFEQDFRGHVVWAHPPRAIIHVMLEHFAREATGVCDARIVILIPEDTSAPWFRVSLLRNWHRIRSWQAGSDIFRWVSATGCRQGPRTDLQYSVLQNWQPAGKRKRTAKIIPSSWGGL